MHSPAGAIAWEFRRQHPWAPVALLGYVVIAVAFKLLVLGADTPVRVIPPDGRASVVIAPFSTLAMYFVAVFSFGFSGDLAGRPSIFPRRLFTLPVTTAALAGWPMLYGGLAMAGLWLITASIARWPWGAEVPVVWPALYAAAFLAWTQVLAWWPYGMRGIRVAVAVAWLTTINVVVFSAAVYEVPETIMIAILAPQLPLAYLAARFAVARARRGDVPDWSRLWSGSVASAGRRRPEPDRFRSPAAAQRWFEWRQHGLALPVWIAILLPIELALLLVPGNDTPELVFITLVVALMTPPFMAAFAGVTARRSSSASNAFALAPFIATRPLSSRALAVAKLTNAAWSTCAAWLVVLIVVPVGLALSGTWPIASGWAGDLLVIMGAPRAVAAMTLVGVVFVAATWALLVQALGVGMTGRAWLVKASMLLWVSLLIITLSAMEWFLDSAAGRSSLWRTLPWLLGGLVAAKTAVATSSIRQLARQRLVDGRALVAGATLWLMTVLVLYGVLVWLVALPPSMPRHLALLAATLIVPFVRPSVAPLAVFWNRHRGTAQATATPAAMPRAIGLAMLLVVVPAGLALGQIAIHIAGDPTDGAVVSTFRGRDYLLYAPPGHDRARPAPLVISLHGGASWPDQQMHMSGWNRQADEHGFLVLYPSGTGFPRAWRAIEPGAALDTEVQIVSELIDHVAVTYAIDTDRIYANGMSNGAGMSFVLSCRLPDRIAAVGLVSSAQFLPFTWCEDRQPMPMIAFHGTADALTPYRGGTSWVVPRPVPDMLAWTTGWAVRNRCPAPPTDTPVAADVTRLSYEGCASGSDVDLYTIDGGGHTWPGGEPLPEWLAGVTSHSIDATEQMWAFFRDHPRRD